MAKYESGTFEYYVYEKAEKCVDRERYFPAPKKRKPKFGEPGECIRGRMYGRIPDTTAGDRALILLGHAAVVGAIVGVAVGGGLVAGAIGGVVGGGGAAAGGGGAALAAAGAGGGGGALAPVGAAVGLIAAGAAGAAGADGDIDPCDPRGGRNQPRDPLAGLTPEEKKALLRYLRGD